MQQCYEIGELLSKLDKVLCKEAGVCRALLGAQDINNEHEGRICRDAVLRGIAITLGRRDYQQDL